MMPSEPASPDPTAHLGWHDRRGLPHRDIDGLVQLVTFRLADSMPQSLLEKWEVELEGESRTVAEVIRRRRIECYLDAGYGACHLRQPRIAEMVVQSLRHFDQTRYRLRAWCVMPNHVHVLFDQWSGYPLHSIVQSWKSWTAKRANEMLARRGQFWQREYHDRFIRDAAHLAKAVSYIEQNPVTARLVTKASDWRWSSAALQAAGH